MQGGNLLPLLPRSKGRFFDFSVRGIAAQPLWQKAIITAAIFIAGSFAVIFGLPCPFEKMGLYCFGCGTTRAFRAAFAFDFESAFAYNGMFWSLPVLWCFWMTDFRIFRREKTEKNVKILFAAIVLGYIVDYCFRIL